MRTIDLNIKLDEKVMKRIEDGVDKKGAPQFKEVEMSSADVAVSWISVMVERALNKPTLDPRSGRQVPTIAVNMSVQRQYGKLMDALEAHVDGIVNIEDDLFVFLDRKYHQAEISVQREINVVLNRIDDAIVKAKIA